MLLVRLGANIHIIFYKCKNFPSYFKEIWEITLFEDSVGSERGVFSGHGNHDDENKHHFRAQILKSVPMVGTLCTKWWHTLYQALAHFKKSEAKIWVCPIFLIGCSLLV